MGYITLLNNNVVRLPEEICKKLGLHEGQSLEIRESSNQIILVPIKSDIGKESPPSLDLTKDPELFIGVTPGGLGFEIPPDKIPDFLCILTNVLKPNFIKIHYQVESSLQEISCLLTTFDQEIKRIGEFVRDSSLVIEYNTYTLYSGGGGCFSLEASLDPSKKKQIASSILKLFGLSQELPREELEIYYDGQRV